MELSLRIGVQNQGYHGLVYIGNKGLSVPATHPHSKSTSSPWHLNICHALNITLHILLSTMQARRGVVQGAPYLEHEDVETQSYW